MNRYSYVSNSPITRIDPSGHSDSDYRNRMNRLRKAYGDKYWFQYRRAYHRGRYSELPVFGSSSSAAVAIGEHASPAVYESLARITGGGYSSESISINQLLITSNFSVGKKVHEKIDAPPCWLCGLTLYYGSASGVFQSGGFVNSTLDMALPLFGDLLYPGGVVVDPLADSMTFVSEEEYYQASFSRLITVAGIHPASILMPGGKPVGKPTRNNPTVWTMQSEDEMAQVFDNLIVDAKQYSPKNPYEGIMYQLSDGGTVGWRYTGASGGPAIDINIPGLWELVRRIHLP